MTISVVALMIGTLPLIDNWSHVGGFVFGLLYSKNCSVNRLDILL